MRQFNLEEYMKNPNQKVVTRDGHKVRILCTDRKHEYPILALIDSNSTEEIVCYTINGKCYRNTEDDSDLFFAPEKKLYSFKEGDRVLARDSDTSWSFDYFDSYNREDSFYPYMCRYAPYEQCIPLNEHTWKLLGTTDEYKEETTD